MGQLRKRYYLLASVLYLVLGIIIIARTLLAHVLPLAILGLVFLALGAVRLRDYYRSQGSFR
ncbi:MAG: hypothetical protein M3Z66_08700 [Chloroflexota bacterium]|nr:hypothetical protein [Chloroflexota bacterium]